MEAAECKALYMAPGIADTMDVIPSNIVLPNQIGMSINMDCKPSVIQEPILDAKSPQADKSNNEAKAPAAQSHASISLFATHSTPS